MAQYEDVNVVKLSNSQLPKLKISNKNATGVTLTLSSNMIGNSNNEAANRPVANPSKTFANILSAKMKLPKTQISKKV